MLVLVPKGTPRKSPCWPMLRSSSVQEHARPRPRGHCARVFATPANIVEAEELRRPSAACDDLARVEAPTIGFAGEADGASL